MNKSKKFLAFLTALSISASSFVGAATAVFAAENSISYQDGTVSITYDAEKDVVNIHPVYNLIFEDGVIVPFNEVYLELMPSESHLCIGFLYSSSVEDEMSKIYGSKESCPAGSIQGAENP